MPAFVVEPGNWAVSHVPAANTKGTVTVAAPPAGNRHVITGVIVTACCGGTAPTAAQQDWNLLEGSTSRMGGVMAWQATAGYVVPPVALDGLEIPMTPATAVTLEFENAGGANTFEAVTLIGRTEPI